MTRTEAVEALQRAWRSVRSAPMLGYRADMWRHAVACFNSGNYGMAYNWAGMIA